MIPLENTTVNSTNSLCQLAKLISNQTQLRIIYILELLIGLAVLFTTSLTLYILCKVKVFHVNLRLILANLTCNLALYSVSTVIKVYKRLTDDPCTFPILLKTCMIQDFSITIPIHNSLMSLIILSLERLYATIRFRTYDYSGSVPYLGIILIISSWAVTCANNISGYYYVPDDILIPICETVLAASRRGLIKSSSVILSSESIAALITISVYIYNRYLFNHMAINRAMYGLSARFQINQNVQVNKALMPSMLFHTAVFLPAYGTLCFIIFLDIPISIGSFVCVLHLTYLYRLLYALVDPIILITRNESLRRAVKKTELGKFIVAIGRIFKRNKEQNVINSNLQGMYVTNVHFDMLGEAWGVKRTENTSRKKVKVAFT